VSGHVTLSEKTGAPIIFGPTAAPSFEATVAMDDQEFKLGNVTLKVLHTPGHTMESISILLLDENGKEHSLFSGDTLFLGDVGRPDLAQKAASMTQEELAGVLYDSIRTKIMTLPDEVVVYPGHGAGSACGKNMSSETVGSIGHEKANNYALRADMTREEFVKEVTHGLATPPAYFPLNVQMNKAGYEDIEEVLKRGDNGLSPDEFEAAANETGAIVLDVRHQFDFVKGFIPRSTFIGVQGGFAPWVGALIKDVKQPILIVADKDKLEEAVTRLSRVGFDNVIGYLEGGFEAWKNSGKEIDTIDTITPAELADMEKGKIVDVRKITEYGSERVASATNAPLDNLNDYLNHFEGDEDVFVHCLGGYRSVIAISILKARGIHNVVNVLEGFNGLKDTKIPMTDYVCPTTL